LVAEVTWNVQKERFRVAGQEFELDKKTVEQKLNTIKAKKVKKVYVKVRGKEFPVNQALAESVPSLIRSQVKTQEAVRVLGALGFIPKEKKPKE